MSNRGDVLAAWAAASRGVVWEHPWDEVHVPGADRGQWFPGGALNVSFNCLDRHLPERRDRVALFWEGEPGDRRAITYGELHADVCAFAESLRRLGVRAGDRVALHMGLLPETVVAMLACARLGAVHAVMAEALPVDALAGRLVELRPRVLVTQDGAWRHGVILPLKARADEALAAAATVQHTVVVRRTGNDVAWYEGDLWYQELVARSGGSAAAASIEVVSADHPLLVVYIANRRGRPTGIVHASGGFLVYARAVHEVAFSSTPDDVVWHAVDVAWVVGQTHAVYGPLACGGTSVVYEGMLDTPSHTRAWEIVERYGVGVLMTTPSVVRALRLWSQGAFRRDGLASLRHVVTAGEAIDPGLRGWLREAVGSGRVTLGDAWGQTELGGVVTMTETASGRPLIEPGLRVLGPGGQPAGEGRPGELVLAAPGPGTFLGIEGDDGAAAARYWKRYPGLYATRDRAVRTGGAISILGRMDPVISVAGQLVSLTEVREVLHEHPLVDDVEIIERPDPRRGLAVVACVVLAEGVRGGEELAAALRQHVRDTLGGLAQPGTVAFVERWPAGMRGEARRSALRALCAAPPADTMLVSEEDLRAAAAGRPGTGGRAGPGL